MTRRLPCWRKTETFSRVSLWRKSKRRSAPEANGGDVGFGIEFFLVVAVPAHALVAVGVEIEEAGVVVGAGGGFDGFFDDEEFWSPDFGSVGVAGVAVVEVAVAIPGHLAGGDDAFAEHHGFVVLPRDVLEKRFGDGSRRSWWGRWGRGRWFRRLGGGLGTVGCSRGSRD